MISQPRLVTRLMVRVYDDDAVGEGDDDVPIRFDDSCCCCQAVRIASSQLAHNGMLFWRKPKKPEPEYSESQNTMKSYPSTLI